MKGRRFYWFLFVCFYVVILLLSGCGGTYTPLSPASESTETGKTAKVLLRINFGEERARGDLLPLIKEAQRKKVSGISGGLYNDNHYYPFGYYDLQSDAVEIELEIAPGIYALYIGAYQKFENGRSDNLFSFYEERLEFGEGVNEKTTILELNDWQPVLLSFPEDILAEPDENECFGARGQCSDGNFYGCFELFASSSTLVGVLPLDATEINLRLNDKVYQIEPQKFLDALVFDEPVSLADCQWKLITMAVLNVDIGGPNVVVAGARDVLALKFKIEAVNDFPINNIGIKMNGSENDIDWVELILHDDQGDIILGQNSPNDRIDFNISPALEIPAKTSRIFSFFVDIPLSAQNGNTFSFSVESINGNPNFAFKEVGPEFTIARTGILSVKTDWNPASAIVLAGSTGNNFLAIELSAEGEEFKIKSLTFQVIDGGYCGDIEGEYKDISNVAIYDGATKLAENWIYSSGRTFYFNTATSATLIIPNNNRGKTLSVKADLATIDPDFDNAPGTNSADVKIILTEVEAVGTTSNIYVVLHPTIESNAMVLRNSKPIVECSVPWDIMGAATSLTNGAINLFNFKVTADSSGGEVLQNKVGLMFQCSDPNMRITDIRILDENGYILNYGSPVCEGDCSAGFSLNNPDFDAGEESIRIPSGEHRNFYVWAVVSGVKTGDTIAITLLGDNACNPVGTATELAAQNNFVWSDNYRQTSLASAPNYRQWYNGHLVPGLANPTPYIILAH